MFSTEEMQPRTAMPDTNTLYDQDFFAWTQQQADALRAARARSNEPIDWENIAEEIEDLGKRDRRELASRISNVLEHFVKLSYSPARDPRNNWQRTIRRERGDIERLLEDSPSLKREIPALIQREKPRAVRAAIDELQHRGEINPPLRRSLKTKGYLELFDYTADQVLGDWFPPAPKPPAGKK